MVHVFASAAPNESAAAGEAADPASAAGAAQGAAAPRLPELTPAGFQRSELVRLITQAIRSLGYGDTAASLERESGILLESPAVVQLGQFVVAGRWDETVRSIRGIELRAEADRKTMLCHVAEQRFLELLEARDTKSALAVLRDELRDLAPSPAHLNKLSSYVMCSTAADVRTKAGWAGRDGGSREHLVQQLRSYIAPSTLVPEGRLEALLHQACERQQTLCLYHNEMASARSLYVDHECDRNAIPRTTRFVFAGHTDEVWYVAFSNNGELLASACKDGHVIIWDVANHTQKRILRGSGASVSFVAWSPDDRYLVTCRSDGKARLWTVATGLVRATMSTHTEGVTSAAWLPDSQRFVTGSLDKTVILWDLNGVSQFTWRTSRVTDVAIDAAGQQLVVAGQDKRILLYHFGQAAAVSVFQETDMITSLSVTKDGTYALVSLSSKQIHLLDLQRGVQLQKYTGHVQGKYVIRSCFGGLHDGFVLSGSEDNNVYLWNRHHGKLVEVLHGHTNVVNSVAWCPTNPTLVASASDDTTVRLWAPEGDSGGRPASRMAVEGSAGAAGSLAGADATGSGVMSVDDDDVAGGAAGAGASEGAGAGGGGDREADDNDEEEEDEEDDDDAGDGESPTTAATLLAARYFAQRVWPPV